MISACSSLLAEPGCRRSHRSQLRLLCGLSHEALSKQYLINTSSLKKVFKPAHRHLHERIPHGTGHEAAERNQYFDLQNRRSSGLPNPKKIFISIQRSDADASKRMSSYSGFQLERLKQAKGFRYNRLRAPLLQGVPLLLLLVISLIVQMI